MGKFGIVCEGGGARGAYTGGFLAWCIDNNIPTEYICGISAGAVMAELYLSKQTERMKRLSTKYIANPRYAGLSAILHEGQFGGLNYAFDIIGEQDPIDFETYKKNPIEFEYGLFHCENGAVEYFGKEEALQNRDIFKACCRLPGLCKIGKIGSEHYYDGGVATMIPLSRAQEKGITHNIVILTKHEGYIRKPEKKWQMFFIWLFQGHKYPKLMEALKRRHIEYKEEMEHVEECVKNGTVLLLRPSIDLHVGRMCKDGELLNKMWDLGYQDSEAHRDDIMALIERAKK